MQSVLAQPDTWLTTVEKTDFRETPRYAETMAFCQRLADVSPMATFGDYGTSPQGRRLPLLV
ncbi:MAG TPA: carboxypeptidase, partial [Calditrichia bacterium]|nr:carboxypeptidase [Calditrichia bacterium]